MFSNMTEQQAKDHILRLVGEYHDTYRNRPEQFKPGDRVPYAGRVYDKSEMVNLVDSALEFWLTASRFSGQLEKDLSSYLGVKHCALVNSGSSANLLAFMMLTSPLLEDRAILPGDEVITVAAAFPTTVSPIIQYGAIPVFVDVTIPQYNIDVSMLEAALSEKTKAVMLAHTLGNPFDIQAVKDFCGRHKLWLIEDNCDALGSVYTYDGEEKLTGSAGDIGTSSFYPAHHITTGEGGAVYTSNPLLSRIMFSMRDWGRDCVCTAGQDNMCGHRFDRQFGELPLGYDHKYVYSHFGYNMKITDLQASIGLAQIKKLPGFVEARRNNFDTLLSSLTNASSAFILPEPFPGSKPSWFGFTVTCKDGFDRSKIVPYIESKGVQTRMLFAGNILKHPCFDTLRKTGTGYRVAGELTNTDKIMNDTFWVGVYPGMTQEKIDYMAEVMLEAIER